MPEAAGDLERALGARFRRVREERGVPLLRLARALGCSVNTVRWHEAGATPFRAHHLVLAAAALGVGPGELLLPEGLDARQT